MGRSRDLADGTLAELNVDSNTLAVDATNNRVGVGTGSPAGKFQAEGTNSGIVIDTSTAYTPVIKASGALSDLKLAAVGNGGLFLIDVNGAERMRLDSSGNLLVGTTSTYVYGSTASGSADGWVLAPNGGGNVGMSSDITWNKYSTGAVFGFRYDGTQVGNISISTTNTSYNTSSDYRLKENVVEVTDGISRVKLLKPSRFNFIVDPDKTVDGFLAHEVADVVPEAITGTKNEVDADGNPKYQGIDQSKLVPLLTAALQEAITKIESLETEMITVKSRLDALESA